MRSSADIAFLPDNPGPPAKESELLRRSVRSDVPDSLLPLWERDACQEGPFEHSEEVADSASTGSRPGSSLPGLQQGQWGNECQGRGRGLDQLEHSKGRHFIDVSVGVHVITQRISQQSQDPGGNLSPLNKEATALPDKPALLSVLLIPIKPVETKE